MFKRIVFLIIPTLVVSKVFAQTTTGSDSESLNAIETSVPFLTIAPDSRAGAMGDAGVATSPDLNSQHWNAAKYAFMEERAGAALAYTPWLQNLGVTDLNLLYLSGFYKFAENQTISGGLRYFNLGEIQEIDENGIATGQKIRPHEFAVDAGYSRLFGRYISGGLVFRFIYSNIANGISLSAGQADYEPGMSVAGDVSVYYQRPVQVSGYDAEMAYGLNISNIGNKLTYSQSSESQFIPTNMRLGGRFTLDIDEYNSIGATLDLNKLLVPTEADTVDVGPIEGIFKSFGDAPGGATEELNEIMYSVGVEYWYMKQFAIRAGYFHEHQTKGNRKYFTAGVGMNLNVFSLDFSYLFPTSGGGTSPLANTMRFTLGFRFE